MEFEQLSIFDFIDHPPELKIEKPIRLIELFAGIGAQAAALERLGANFEHYRVCEFDKYAIASYNAIHGTNFETSDIREIHASDLGIVNRESFTYLLTYSFPCTDLSVAGRMAGMSKESGTRSGLLWEVERLLEECGADLPQILVMENVPQVHGTKNREDFDRWCEFLNGKGYTNAWQDMNAKNFGVAQSRNRCFMVSWLGNYIYDFPKPIPLKKRMKDYLEDSVDDKYYIRNEKAKKLIQKLIDSGTIPGKEGDEVKRSERKCIYCDNLLGKKGCLGMCNKHYIQYKRWGDPLHSDKKERATVDGYYRDGKTGRREHRIIYEQYYGILLSDEEVIHHINFVKTDNRIENLWKYPSASEHTKAHWEYEKLYETLSENEEIYFENGHYLKREREREYEQTDD